MLNMHILKAKDPQSQRRSLQENKRVATMKMSRWILVPLKLLEIRVYEELPLSSTDLTFFYSHRTARV